MFLDDNDCTIDSCNGRGFCLDDVASVVCECDEGYAGIHCEIGIEIYSFYMNEELYT